MKRDIRKPAPFLVFSYQIDNVNHKLNIDIPDGQVSRNLGFKEEGKGIVIYSIQDNNIP
ncbi:MAG: hypothetical protein IJU93_01330 [Lachnospiraceae bacterium]|nr:hypothetical protein [Lachnospiraceae bacterium]